MPATERGPASPAQALWNQRLKLASLRDRFRALSAAVNRPTDLWLFQWAELAALALEFHPDLILELGRGRGNSTCCFLEVAHQLGGARACRLVSLCLSDDWFTLTLPRLQPLVSPEWLAAGEIRQDNILDYDISAALEPARRCLVFWDAHGFEVAEWVLGKLLPQLAPKLHLVVMHDLCDLRFETLAPDYGTQGLWKGTNAEDPAFWLGHIFSRVAQAISIVDFTSRNQLPLHSAAESLHTEIAADLGRKAELEALLGEEFFSLQAHWFWFTLNQAPHPLTFPRYTLEAHRHPPTETQSRARLEKIQDRLRSLQRTAAGENLRDDLDWLLDAVQSQHQELARLRAEKHGWEATWAAVEKSAGWRLLNTWRGLRERLVPGGTRRRALYDRVLRNFRGGR